MFARVVSALRVDELVRRDLDQPAPWVAGQPLGRPLLRRGEECLLQGVLARGEVAVAPKQSGQDVGRLFPPQLF